MSQHIEKYPRKASRHVLALFESLETHQKETMLLLSCVLGNLRVLGLDVTTAANHANQISGKSSEHKLMRIEILLNLKSKEFSLDDIQFLWDLIGSRFQSQAMTLLLSMQKLVPNLWAQSVSTILSSPDVYACLLYTSDAADE